MICKTFSPGLDDTQDFRIEFFNGLTVWDTHHNNSLIFGRGKIYDI